MPGERRGGGGEDIKDDRFLKPASSLDRNLTQAAKRLGKDVDGLKPASSPDRNLTNSPGADIKDDRFLNPRRH